jgi:hypothetical protein
VKVRDGEGQDYLTRETSKASLTRGGSYDGGGFDPDDPDGAPAAEAI